MKWFHTWVKYSYAHEILIRGWHFHVEMKSIFRTSWILCNIYSLLKRDAKCFKSRLYWPLGVSAGQYIAKVTVANIPVWYSEWYWQTYEIGFIKLPIPLSFHVRPSKHQYPVIFSTYHWASPLCGCWTQEKRRLTTGEFMSVCRY